MAGNIVGNTDGSSLWRKCLQDHHLVYRVVSDNFWFLFIAYSKEPWNSILYLFSAFACEHMWSSTWSVFFLFFESTRLIFATIGNWRWCVIWILVHVSNPFIVRFPFPPLTSICLDNHLSPQVKNYRCACVFREIYAKSMGSSHFQYQLFFQNLNASLKLLVKVNCLQNGDFKIHYS